MDLQTRIVPAYEHHDDVMQGIFASIAVCNLSEWYSFTSGRVNHDADRL